MQREKRKSVRLSFVLRWSSGLNKKKLRQQSVKKSVKIVSVKRKNLSNFVRLRTLNWSRSWKISCLLCARQIWLRLSLLAIYVSTLSSPASCLTSEILKLKRESFRLRSTIVKTATSTFGTQTNLLTVLTWCETCLTNTSNPGETCQTSPTRSRIPSGTLLNRFLSVRATSSLKTWDTLLRLTRSQGSSQRQQISQVESAATWNAVTGPVIWVETASPMTNFSLTTPLSCLTRKSSSRSKLIRRWIYQTTCARMSSSPTSSSTSPR